MGGGHVSRPDFGMPQPDAAYPLTEFYLLAQQALEKSGSFMLPALYAGLHAPARRIYREEAAGYLQLAAAPAEGLARLLSPARVHPQHPRARRNDQSAHRQNGIKPAVGQHRDMFRFVMFHDLFPPFIRSMSASPSAYTKLADAN